MVSTLRTDPEAPRGLPPVRPPFPVQAPHVVLPAPRLLGDAPHVVLDDAWPAALRRRLHRLGAEPEAVLVREPGGPRAGLDDALRQAWSLLPLRRDGDVVHLPHLGAQVDVRSRRATGTGPEVPGRAALLALPPEALLLVGWLLACSDDLVVLRRTGPAALVAELLGVAFPSGWSPRERAGASLEQLHAPVADGDRLRRATPALSQMLLTKGPYVQHVWGLSRSGRLDDDTGDPGRAGGDDRDGADAGGGDGRWWLRVERQTSLPLGDRALFTIRPYLTPLEELTREQRAVLDAALASMSPASRAYKGVPAAGLPPPRPASR